MSNYPIVKVKTTDGLTLHGLLSTPDKSSKTIVIHLHGTSGNFFFNEFYEGLIKSANKLEIAQLNTNNRGAGVYELEKDYPESGSSLEKFENCLMDIDAWINYVLKLGYKNIVLEGHSFGTEKIVYYMEKGKHKDKVTAVILLGFSDNVGTMQKYLKSINKDYATEAKKLVKKGQGHKLLNDIWGLAGEMPISAQTYLNFTSKNSENSKALPLRKGKDLTYFRHIQVPILGVIGDMEDHEYTIIPIQQAINLLKSENELAEIHQIKNCNHDFEGKEEELSEVIANFLKRKVT